jgi:LemA protein
VEALWVVLGIIVVLAIAGVVSYNRFVSQKNLIKDAWANIDTELRRRYDLIPNIVETVKGYATHERELFENVTQARANATGATGSPAAQAAAEGPLVAALRQLFAVVENYPDLKANQNFLALQAELTNTEDRLQTARRFYNANVRDYNERVQSVPSNVIANLFNFEEEEFFEVEEALRGDEGVPKVSFEAGAPGVSFGTPSEPSTAPPASPRPPRRPSGRTNRPGNSRQLIEGIGSDPASGSGSAPPKPVRRTPRLSTNHAAAQATATPPRIVTVIGAPI